LAKVIVKANENIEDTLRKFNNDLRRSGTLKEIKKRKYYDKPGVRKRKRIKENLKNKKYQ